MNQKQPSNKNIIQKIKKYVKTKNWKKIGKISNENRNVINIIVDKKRKRNIVHILCHKLLYDILSLVLFDEYDYLITDKKKNTALHLALKSCIKKNKYFDVIKYWDLFVEKNPEIKMVKNKRCETPFDLLMYISSELNKPKIDEEQQKWIEELEDEANSDYMNEWGKYEQDYFGEHIEYESYESWTERMHYEYNKKHSYFPTPSNSNEKKPSYNSEEKDRILREKYAKLKQESLNKSSYESFKEKWIAFESKIRLLQEGDQIMDGDIPWLPMDIPSESLLQMITDFIGGQDNVRKELKLLQIAWHPDRFMNRCGRFISSVQQKLILGKVVQISQLINNAIGVLDK